VENNLIAVTIDDGPMSGPTDTALATLTAKGVTASFFVLGTNVDAAGNLLQQEVTKKHSTLSHSFSHPSLPSLSKAEIYDEMHQTELSFASFTCRRPTLMRPPYGEIDDSVRDILQRMGYRAVVWNLDTNDWRDAATNPTKVTTDFNTNLAALKPLGVISLQHDIEMATVALLPTDIDTATRQGYTFVSVERCMWGPTYQRHPSWVFMHGKCDTAEANWPVATVPEPCPLSDWSVWSPCDTTCGAGTQTRVRMTMPPGRELLSQACAANQLIQAQACTAAACPTGCTFGPWTNWGTCSNTCGGGTQIATRTKTAGGATCGPVLKTQLCNTQACTPAGARRALRGDAASE